MKKRLGLVPSVLFALMLCASCEGNAGNAVLHTEPPSPASSGQPEPSAAIRTQAEIPANVSREPEADDPEATLHAMPPSPPEWTVTEEDGTLVLRAEGEEWAEYWSFVQTGSDLYVYAKISRYAINMQGHAVVRVQPETLRAETVFTQWMPLNQNEGYNAFVGNIGMLGAMDDGRALFLEPEVAADRVIFHLSAIGQDGQIERLRPAFWQVESGEKIYMHRWSRDRKRLLLQSEEGNVWIFDLAGGTDRFHPERFRVIPHSTTGYPSLFPSPTLERFAFDDESGKLGFYDETGKLRGTVELSGSEMHPSPKVGWNETGTVAWIASAPSDQRRIKAIDIDYLFIAPARLDFYDRDGRPLSSVKAADAENLGSVEVAGWTDAWTAVLKEYRFDSSAEPAEKDVTFSLLDVKTGQKRKYSSPHFLASSKDRTSEWAMIRTDPTSVWLAK